MENLKDHARCIADLPENEFNELVLNARDFSLARGRPPSQPIAALAMSSSSRILSNHDYDDDEDSCSNSRINSTVTSMSGNVLKLDLRSSVQKGCTAAGIIDDDSGLPSSTKTGHGPTSVSSFDDEKEMEERGVFDYVPAKPGKEKRERVVELKELGLHLKVSHTYNPQYDEAVPVENDNESIESPRSDVSSTREYDLTSSPDNETEMTTFRTERTNYRDEDKSSDDEPHLNVHNGWKERPRASSTSSINFSRSVQHIDKGQTISGLRSASAVTSASVDDPVQFGLRARGPSCCSPDYTLLRPSPPFGTGDNQLNRVGHSLINLLNPAGAGNSDGQGGSGDDLKKKKKKETKGNIPFPFVGIFSLYAGKHSFTCICTSFLSFS